MEEFPFNDSSANGTTNQPTDGENPILCRIRSNDPTFNKLWISPLRFGSQYYPNSNGDWKALANALAQNVTLKTLIIVMVQSPFVRKDNLNALCNGLNYNKSISTLSIRSSSIFGGDIFLTLTPFLEKNPNLDHIDLCDCHITPNGMSFLSSALKRRSKNATCKSVTTFSLSNDDIGSSLEELAESLTLQTGLKSLYLNKNNIGRSGCITLASLLLDPNLVNLRTLSLSLNNIDDEGAVIIANSLFQNKALRHLYLRGNLLTNTGWMKLSQLLCDESSIDATYFSNHTICSMGDGFLPRMLESHLLFNQNEDKKHVAHWKVIEQHFSESGMGEFHDMEFKLFPHVLSWIGQYDDGFPTFYQFFKSMIPIYLSK